MNKIELTCYESGIKFVIKADDICGFTIVKDARKNERRYTIVKVFEDVGFGDYGFSMLRVKETPGEIAKMMLKMMEE